MLPSSITALRAPDDKPGGLRVVMRVHTERQLPRYLPLWRYTPEEVRVVCAADAIGRIFASGELTINTPQQDASALAEGTIYVLIILHPVPRT